MDEIVRTIETKSGPINIRKDKDGNEYGWVPEDELEIVDTTELEYEEQPFFNNGQFTENELDLLSEALNDLLQKLNKIKFQEIQRVNLSSIARINFKLETIENLIEKIQEGS